MLYKVIILFVLLHVIVINSKPLNFNNYTTDNNRNDNNSTLQKYRFIKKNVPKTNNNYNKVAVKNAENVNEGRGKNKKLKKKLGMMIPVILIMLAAKSIFLPFLLKGLTVVSASSFILSKISLILSLLILLRLLYDQNSNSKLEIHNVPIKFNKHGWSNRQAVEYGDDLNGLDDLSYTSTNYSSSFPYNHFHLNRK